MADPLDILYGRAPAREGDDFSSSLATIAAAIQSIPERRARAAQQRAQLEKTQLEGYNEQLKAQEMQRKVQDLQLIDQAWQSGNRDEFINRLPGHVRVSVLKGLAELDKADSERKEALEKARKITDDSIARQLQFVAGTGYDPHIAQGAISELKVRYKDDPQLLQQFGLVEKAIQENPTTEHVKMLTDAMIRKSDEQRKADEAAQKAKTDEALSQQKLTGSEPVQPTTRAQIDAENKRAEEARAAQAAAQAEAARHNRAVEGGTAAGRAETARHNREMEAARTTDKPPTGQQRRALGFFNRAKEADDNLNVLEDEVSKMGVVGTAWMKNMPNLLQSETGQKYNQAQRAFTEARLRKDSGATIKDSEYESDRRTFFAEPGDSSAVLEQKRRARAAQLASLAAESGDSALREFYGDEGPTLVDIYRSKSAKSEAKKNPFRP